MQEDDGYKNYEGGSDTKSYRQRVKRKDLEAQVDDDKFVLNDGKESQIHMATLILKQAIPGMFCMVTLML